MRHDLAAPAPAETYSRWIGLLDDRAAADAQIRAVFPERRVQRGKDVAANVGIAAQVLLDAVGSATFGRAASRNARLASEQTSRPLGRLPSSESSGAKWPLTKTSWQAAPATRKASISLRGDRSVRPWPRGGNGVLRQRREIGEAPVLVVRGGKSLGVKARPARLRAIAAATPGSRSSRLRR